MTLQVDKNNRLRALGTSTPFWLAMFAASAFGTNLGDLWTGHLGLPIPVAFAALLLTCALAIWGDRRIGLKSEVAYWVAIVVLRAAATNVADLVTEKLGFGYVPVSVELAILALAAGLRTSSGMASKANASPVIDGWYWTAMFIAGVFGTVAGDLMNRTVGVVASAAILATVLAGVLLIRERLSAGLMLSYWIAVLAERAAGTPIGDGLASRRGAGFGLELATICTFALLGAALVWREWTRKRLGVRL